MNSKWCNCCSHGKLIPKNIIHDSLLTELDPYFHLLSPEMKVYKKMVKDITGANYKGPQYSRFFEYMFNFFLNKWHSIDSRFRIKLPISSVSNLNEAFSISLGPVLHSYERLHKYQYKKIPQYIIPYYIYWLRNYVSTSNYLLNHNMSYNTVILKYISSEGVNQIFQRINSDIYSKTERISIREKTEADEPTMTTLHLLDNLNRYISHYEKTDDLRLSNCYITNCAKIDYSKGDFVWMMLENTYNSPIGKIELHSKKNLVNISFLPLFDADIYKLDALRLSLDGIFKDSYPVSSKKVTVTLRVNNIKYLIDRIQYKITHIRDKMVDKRQWKMFVVTKS